MMCFDEHIGKRINRHYTVGRMGEINPKSNSSKFCFRTFYSIVNTPTKKNFQHKTPCYLPVFRYLPSKSKLWRKRWSFPAAEGSTLEPNISDSVWIIYSIYIRPGQENMVKSRPYSKIDAIIPEN